jgi:uncharacterized membrane protein YkvA (DUF1232 family)
MADAVWQAPSHGWEKVKCLSDVRQHDDEHPSQPTATTGRLSHCAAFFFYISWLFMLEKWKQWARIIRRDAHALYLAARDPRVPWYAKVLAIVVAAYALSPIDLIPDFVPVLGYVDDLIIVPAGIALVIRLIPPEIMAEHREIAIAAQDRPVSRAAAVAIVTIWVVAIGLTVWMAIRYLS